MAHKGEKRCRLYGWVTHIKHENIIYRAHTPQQGNRLDITQGSKGIRQWPMNRLYITNDDTQNYLFFGLKLLAETFGHSTL